jgi:hypothetical protein
MAKSPVSAAGLPKAPAPPSVSAGVTAESLARRIDQFLTSRGYTAPARQSSESPSPASTTGAPAPPKSPSTPVSVEKPADFVCEDDVRQAMRTGRKISIGERTIVTPAARDLAEQHRVFVQAGWPAA